MILLLVFPFMLVLGTVSVNIHVRREKKGDTIFWDGDCRKLNAEHSMLGEKEVCVCHKRINADGRTLVLDGTFYQNMGLSPKCLYNPKEIGKILNYFYHFDSHVVLNNV